MTDALLAYGIAKMKEYGIVDSGDAKTNGHRRDDRGALAGFLRDHGKAGVYPKTLDFQQGVHPAVRQQEGRERRVRP